jgi:hypothetical protein
VARDREWVIVAWAPPHLHALLTRWFWKDDQPAVSANKVWLDTCRYLYMPRLRDAEVFAATIRDGIAHQDWFGYAAAAKEGGTYAGLLFGQTGVVYLGEHSVLVRADAARAAAQPKVDPGPTERGSTDTSPGHTGGGAGGNGSKVGEVSAYGSGGERAKRPSAAPGVAAKRRFHGTVTIDPINPIGAFTEIVQSVVEHFTAQYGTEVTLTLDLAARRPAGFETKIVRTVGENAKTLGFNTAEFEED